MATAQIRINKTKQLQMALDALQRRYPLLSEAEMVKVALSDSYHKLQEEHERKVAEWSASLPTMELSDEQQDSLTEALKEANEEDEKGVSRSMTPAEVMGFIEQS